VKIDSWEVLFATVSIFPKQGEMHTRQSTSSQMCECKQHVNCHSTYNM